MSKETTKRIVDAGDCGTPDNTWTTRRPGVMLPVFGITHRKLRYLFNVAIKCMLVFLPGRFGDGSQCTLTGSLTRDRLRFQEGALGMYASTSALDDVSAVVARLRLSSHRRAYSRCQKIL